MIMTSNIIGAADEYLILENKVKKSNDIAFEKYEDVLTMDEVAKCLRVSRTTVQKILKENKLNHIRIGSTIRIPKYSLLVFLGLVEDVSTIDR